MDKELLLDDIIKEKANSESLVLPKDLSLKISETINSLPERRGNKGILAKKATTAAAIIILIICSLSIAFPIYARNVPVVDSVFQFLSDKNIIDRDYVEYSSELNLSKTSNGVTITINNIAYDGIDLSIGYTVESKKEFVVMPYIFRRDFKINGNRIDFGGGGTGEFLNKNVYVGVHNINISNDYLPKEIKKYILGGDVEIPENFIFDFNIDELSDGTKGQWDFKFKVSLDKIKSKVIEVNTPINLSKIRPNLSVNEVIFTPINTVLRTSEDNINTDEVQYFVLDDKGRGLDLKSGSGIATGEANKTYRQYIFRNIYEDTKTVIIVPATRTKEYKEIVENAKGMYEVDSKEVSLNLNGTTILSEGKFGEYKINKIELFEDKTLVHYECSKLLPAAYPYGLIIKDETGKKYSLRKEAVKDQGNNKYIAEIEPLAKDKKYILMAVDLEKQYDLRDDLKFTIEVR